MISSPPNAVIAYRAAPFEDIVGVHWGGFGAVIIQGDQQGRVYYYKQTSKTELGVLTSLGDVGFGAGGYPGRVFAASYAKILLAPPPPPLPPEPRPPPPKPTPTFVISGELRIPGGPGFPAANAGGIIMTSNDGLTWKTALTVAPDDFFRASTWDPVAKAFYLDWTGAGSWTSIDGETWTTTGDPIAMHYPPGITASDGFYGSNPDYVDPVTGNKVGMIKYLHDMPPNCTGLTFAGGIWARQMGSGPSLDVTTLEVSVDDTQTWTAVTPPLSFPGSAIIAAPAADL